jgi:hypothetical protein
MVKRVLITIAIVVFSCSIGWAQVTVSGHSGTWTHGSSVTVTGSGFGSKSTAAPLVWDDCSGTNPLTLWSGAWPDSSWEATYRANYRTPATVGRGVALPHSHVTKYLSGAHYSYWDSPYAGGGRSNTGANVMFWRYTTAHPSYWYASRGSRQYCIYESRLIAPR